MLNKHRSYKKRTHKFNAKICNFDNIKFRSTLEKDYYIHLLKLKNYTKEVLFFTGPTIFYLPGITKTGKRQTYKNDFTVFYADGRIEFVDVKGQETKEFILKKNIIEELEPIEITVIKKGDF